MIKQILQIRGQISGQISGLFKLKHGRAFRRQGHGVAECASLAGHDIAPSTETAGALRKTFHVDGSAFVGPVHMHHHRAIVIVSEITVGVVVGKEMHKLAVVDRRGIPPPTK